MKFKTPLLCSLTLLIGFGAGRFSMAPGNSDLSANTNPADEYLNHSARPTRTSLTNDLLQRAATGRGVPTESFDALLADRAFLTSNHDEIERLKSAALLLENLTPDRVASTFEELLPLAKEGRIPDHLWGAIARKMGETHGMEAIKSITVHSHRVPPGLAELIVGVSQTDPQTATRWVRELDDGGFKNEALAGLYETLAETDPAAAAQAYLDKSAHTRHERRRSYLGSLIKHQELSGALDQVSQLADKMRSYHSPDFASREIGKLYSDLQKVAAHSSFKEQVAAFQTHANEPDLPDRVWRAIAVKGREDRASLMDWAADIPANFPEDQAPAIQAEAIDAMFYHTDLLEEIVPDWMNNHTAHPMYDRIASRYATSVAIHDAGAAQEWADTIRDENLRVRLRESIEKIASETQE